MTSGAVTPLDVIAINSRHSLDRLARSQLSHQLNYTIYQDSHQLNLASRLGLLSDDLLLYDR